MPGGPAAAHAIWNPPARRASTAHGSDGGVSGDAGDPLFAPAPDSGRERTRMVAGRPQLLGPGNQHLRPDEFRPAASGGARPPCPVDGPDRRIVRPRRIGRDTSELQSLAYLVCRLLLEKK